MFVRKSSAEKSFQNKGEKVQMIDKLRNDLCISRLDCTERMKQFITQSFLDSRNISKSTKASIK